MERNKDWLLPTALGAGILLVIGGAGYYLMRGGAPEPEPVVETPRPVVETPAPPPPSVADTAPAPARALPLPPLDESDPEVLGGLTELLGQDAVMRHLVPQRLVRNIVVTIDNVPRQKMALNQRPVQATPGDFITSGEESTMVIAPANYARYEPFVALVSKLDAKTLVSFYRGLEPLFQEAYEDLGHPGASFDMRLNEVIEHLLQTPTPRGQIALVQPSVLYKYADDRLEKLSAGQKLLIRMGVDNATVIKGKLREIQAELL
ncbi:MAG TPA: DUF3014 domain-containing protein [Gammaproteobacteria bacterium]